METRLHRQLKERYGPLRGGRAEVVVSGFRIDAVGPDDELIEVQSGSFAPLRRKLDRLLSDGRRVRVVKPVALRRRIVRRDRPSGPDISARFSPRRGSPLDLFDDLVGIAHLLPHPALALDVVEVHVEEIRVAARDAVATVLGTAFEVRLAADTVAVAVRHGQVRVDGGAPPRSETLLAGDWVTVDGARMTRGRRNPDEIGDWLGGELVARDRPMTEIVDALRRYYDGMIVVQDAAFARTRVTGIYDLRHPAATLANLAASHDATVRRVSPWLLVVTAR